MIERADAIEHPALAASEGTPPGEATLSDRARIGVVLQGAGLLALAGAAGFRLIGSLADGRVDRAGRLTGLRVERGGGESGAATELVALLRALFAGGSLAGRGEARRAARQLLERWEGAPDRISAERAIDDLFEAARFLGAPELAVARAALEGAIVRGSERTPWRSCRLAVGDETEVEPDARSLEELAAAGRWREVVARGRARAPEAPAERIAFARALFALGRFEAVVAATAESGELEARRLRFEALTALGELGAAREALRRLDDGSLGARQRLDLGDTALRVLVNSGEPDAARDWVAAAHAAARGTERIEARLLAVLSALDRSDLDGAAQRFEELRPELESAPKALAREVELQLALSRGEGERAATAAALRLRAERRRLPLVAAGRLWNNLGSARTTLGDHRGAERAYQHATRLLRRCDGPLWLTLAAFNLAEARLRSGKLRDVESILERSTAYNRRAGNVRGLIEDELGWIRWELVRGEPERALARAARLRSDSESARGWARERIALFEARAHGWLGRAAEAKAALGEGAGAIDEETEPEERPFLLALAGESERALEAAQLVGLSALVSALVQGDAPEAGRWRPLGRLDAFRRARLVLDAETLLPGSAPHALRIDAAAVFRRLGARLWAERCERGDAVAWRALARYFERPSGERGALEELLAAVGHPEAELVAVGDDGERRIAGTGARALPEERSAPWGDRRLALRASEIDEPLRALFSLFLRDLPTEVAGGGELDPDSPFVGESAALRESLDRLARFAASELPVLILGENGTGKELAAAEIHRRSARRKGAWVPVNCAGLSETLLLSELFGHARGSFTGADRDRAGVFESGRGGTVFLDEIGDLPLVAQGSLLRVLQEKEVRRLGESLPRKVDVRIVAATNRELERMVEEGTFRQDLFYRLKVAIVTLPPLRERAGDVPLLAERFLQSIAARTRRELKLTPEARRALAAHAWPGNVRELLHALEAAAALSPDGVIRAEILDIGSSSGAPSRTTGDGDYHHQIEAFRRRLIERALEGSNGSLAAAARQLGVTRQYLSQYVRKFGLRVER